MHPLRDLVAASARTVVSHSNEEQTFRVNLPQELIVFWTVGGQVIVSVTNVLSHQAGWSLFGGLWLSMGFVTIACWATTPRRGWIHTNAQGISVGGGPLRTFRADWESLRLIAKPDGRWMLQSGQRRRVLPSSGCPELFLVLLQHLNRAQIEPLGGRPTASKPIGFVRKKIHNVDESTTLVTWFLGTFVLAGLAFATVSSSHGGQRVWCFLLLGVFVANVLLQGVPLLRRNLQEEVQVDAEGVTFFYAGMSQRVCWSRLRLVSLGAKASTCNVVLVDDKSALQFNYSEERFGDLRERLLSAVAKCSNTDIIVSIPSTEKGSGVAN